MKFKRDVLVLLGWYEHRILMGIARYAREAEWNLASRYLYDVQIPTSWKGDGLLATYGSGSDLWEFVRRRSRQCPTVIVGHNAPGVAAPQVCEDNHAAGVMAARHFLQRGYRHFAWLAPVAGSVVLSARRAGFCETLCANGYPCTLLGSVRAATQSPAVFRRCLGRQLRALPKPLALFALDDQIAAQVIELSLELGLAVPQSVAVLGVGNLEIACECSHVPISSVEFDFEAMGYRAALLLDRLMHGRPAPSSPMVLPPRGIVTRQSTDMHAELHPALLRAVQFIKETFPQAIRMDDIAAAAGYSRRRLSQLFARELHQSPAAYLLQIRLEAAKQRLRHSDDKNSLIALTCGFGSERNLHRAFRRVLGLTPQAFRRHGPVARGAAT